MNNCALADQSVICQRTLSNVDSCKNNGLKLRIAKSFKITRQSCRNLKSKKTEGGEYNLLVEVSVNRKEENS